MPSLRPLPPQFALLRPTWSAAAAAQLSYRRVGCAPTFSAARRLYSDPSDSPPSKTPPAANGSQSRPSTEPDNGPTDHAPHDPYAAAAIAAAAAEASGRPVELPQPLLRKAMPHGVVRKVHLSPIRVVKIDSNKRKHPKRRDQTTPQKRDTRPRAEARQQPDSARRKRPERRGKQSPWTKVQRLAQVTAAAADTQTVGRGRDASGAWVGAITRDKILNDEEWLRLKSEVNRIGREGHDDAAAAAAPAPAQTQTRKERRRSLMMGKMGEEGEKLLKGNGHGDVAFRRLVRPQFVEENEREEGVEKEEEKKKGEKTGRFSIGARLRSAIGRVRSTISEAIEDDAPEPGRYQPQSVHKKPLDEQRLDELEALLIQAAQRLRELKGYKPSREDASAYIKSVNVPRRRRTEDEQDWKAELGRPAVVEDDQMAALDEIGELSRPPRSLSQNPNRPLPHFSDRAIPSELYGPREPMDSGRHHHPEDKQKPLKEDLFGDELENLQPESAAVETTTPTTIPHQKKQTPLVNELFPELATDGAEAKQPPIQDRKVPKLDLDFLQRGVVSRHKEASRKDRITDRMQELYVNDIVVVQMSGLSKTLTEADIRRLVPQSSKHMEGWSDPNFIKVIPVRDELTMDRQDRYYVLFRTVHSARSFQDHVRKLHLISKAQGTDSLLSALMPPPGFRNDDGVDLHAALHTYTIGPPAADKIYMNIVPPPYPRPLRDLIARGGYERIVDSGPPSATSAAAASSSHNPDAVNLSSPTSQVTKVLLHFEGLQPPPQDVRRTIARDGRARGIQWLVVGGTQSPDGIVRFDCIRGPETSSKGADSRPRKVPPRYIVSLEDRAEAQRFVQRFNRSTFDYIASGMYEDGEGPPTAFAEVLW